MVAPALRLRSIPSLAFLAAIGLVSSAASGAPPKLRHQADAQGDVTVFGSTLAVDCSSAVPAPPTGTTVSCAGQLLIDDTAPDLYWRDNVANATITSEQARTSATLVMPTGAKVKYARLYWSALKVGEAPDKNVTIDFKGGPTQVVNADESWSISYGFATHPDWYYYQSTADVTDYVAKWGAGDFRVTDVTGLALAGLEVDRAFSAWNIVVFYEKPGDELRNLALFDGFTSIDPGLPGQEKAEVTLSGFLVPPGFSAKMTAFTYEGDTVYTGDHFTFNGQKLSDAENPIDNFFNASRSYLGSPVSGASDVPKLSGKPGTMAGFDLDTANVTALVKAGDTSAKVGAASDLDIFILGGFVTCSPTRRLDYPDFEKKATDANGGALLIKDVVEFVLTAKNTGNDASTGTVLTDVLDPLRIRRGEPRDRRGRERRCEDRRQGQRPGGIRRDLQDGHDPSRDGRQRHHRRHRGRGGRRQREVQGQGRREDRQHHEPGQDRRRGQVRWPEEELAVGRRPAHSRAAADHGDDPRVRHRQRPSREQAPLRHHDQDLPAVQDRRGLQRSDPAGLSERRFVRRVLKDQHHALSERQAGMQPLHRNLRRVRTGRRQHLQGQRERSGLPRGAEQRNSLRLRKGQRLRRPHQRQGVRHAEDADLHRRLLWSRRNGCPTELECTSKDTSIGNCVPPSRCTGGTGGAGGAGGVGATGGGGNADDSGDDGGCGCRVPESSSTPAGALAAVAALGLFGARRRRRG
ncbi:MAG: DUF3344 domain-containing protein [Polyangiaceae bacterium]